MSMLLLCNSSSGIIDTAYYKTASINVGRRQDGRPLSSNTINANFTVKSLTNSFKVINSMSFKKSSKDKKLLRKTWCFKKILIIGKRISNINSKNCLLI